MKTKRILKKTASYALVVPEVACTSAGLVCGGAQAVLQAAADGCGWLKDKSYAGENYIAGVRAKLKEDDAELEKLEAAAEKASLKVGRKAAA